MPYLTGGIVLVVLAIGSTAPGLLQFFTDKFQTIFPDYRERVLKHEAGHFLVSQALALHCGVLHCMVSRGIAMLAGEQVVCRLQRLEDPSLGPFLQCTDFDAADKS